MSELVNSDACPRPTTKATADGGGAAPSTACWALTTPATPAAVWEATSLTATCAGADGIAAIGADPSRRSAPACQVGSYLIVTLEYSSTTLYQVPYHVQ